MPHPLHLPTLQPPGANHAPTLQRWRQRMAALTPHSLLALVHRTAVAGIFWQSARTKVEGNFTITEGTYALFRDEYRLPLLPPDLAAQIATVAEHVFPVMLVLGVCTRLSALALLGMTLVIQVFVYPDAWPTHLAWAGLLLYLAGRGAGVVSLDHALWRAPDRMLKPRPGSQNA